MSVHGFSEGARHPVQRPLTRPIYLDNHATTPVDPRVAGVVFDVMTAQFGNPNSADHSFGAEAVGLLRSAADQVAQLVGSEQADVRFTTGSTEAIVQALSFAHARRPGVALRIALTRIEHDAVRDAVAGLAADGRAELRWIEVDGAACVEPSSLHDALTWQPDLVCVMAANNEVGTIQALEALVVEAKYFGADVLVDATQAVGRIPLSARDWNIDYLVLSAHKIYGPKGAGALVGPGLGEASAPPGFDGHPATPNTPAIAGFGEAIRLRSLEMVNDERRIAALRDRLETRILEITPDVLVNGDRGHRLAGNLHISARNAPNDIVVAQLRNTVAISTGAACASGADAPSHVLRAMGLDLWRQETALRIGVGRFNTEAEIDFAAEAISEAIRVVRSL